MSGEKIEIEGLKPLLKNLRKMDTELVKLVKDVNKEAADMVASTALTLVPRRTGTLAETIRAAGTNAAGVVRAGNNGKVKYGAPIHWGWARHNITPQPFLYEALDKRRDEVIERYASQLEALVGKVF